MNLTDPYEIKRLLLTEEEKHSRNRRKNGWMVFYSRYSVDLKHLPYESLQNLVAAENLRRGNAVARPTPSIQIRIEDAASCSHSQQLPVSYAEGGGYGKFLFEFFQILKCAVFTCFLILLYFGLYQTYLFSFFELKVRGNAE